MLMRMRMVMAMAAAAFVMGVLVLCMSVVMPMAVIVCVAVMVVAVTIIGHIRARATSARQLCRLLRSEHFAAATAYFSWLTERNARGITAFRYVI